MVASYLPFGQGRSLPPNRINQSESGARFKGLHDNVDVWDRPCTTPKQQTSLRSRLKSGVVNSTSSKWATLTHGLNAIEKILFPLTADRQTFSFRQYTVTLITIAILRVAAGEEQEKEAVLDEATWE